MTEEVTVVSHSQSNNCSPFNDEQFNELVNNTDFALDQSDDNDDQPNDDEDYSCHSSDDKDVQMEPTSSPLKRRYKSVNRLPAKRSCSLRRSKWDEDASRIIRRLEHMRCCKKLQCFANANPGYLAEKIRAYRAMSTEQRKTVLRSLLGSDKSFSFDGRNVCSDFLLLAFRFTRPMQSTVKKESLSFRSDSASISDEHVGENSAHVTARVIDDRPCPRKDSIVSFLERLAESTADRMPHKTEWHLPFFQKRMVYEIFVDEYKILYPQTTVPSPDYFLVTWKNCCPKIKVRKHSVFTKCERCEELRDALAHATAHRRCTSDLRDQITAHLNMMRRERLEYKKKRDMAILQPQRYLSFIVDGADQSAYGLPRFETTTKGERGHAMKVRLIGVLRHAVPNQLHLFTMTEEFPTGANHIIEAIHRVLTTVQENQSLPKQLYIQLDNCSKENKNRFLFSYLECLVAWRLFDEIIVGFLPVGHTHEDIDQSFSATSSRLKSADILTLSDMHTELRRCYNNQTRVESMDAMVNWSQLCEEQGCLSNAQQFTQYHYFRFFNCHEGHNALNASKITRCQVRVKSTDCWKSLIGHDEGKSFIKSVPDLSKAPPIFVKCPPGKDKVQLRLNSVEGRVNSRAKMMELYNMRDKVYRSREVPFEWDLTSCVELSCKGQTNEGDDAVHQLGDGKLRGRDELGVSNGAPNLVPTESNNDYSYDLNSFVIVNPESDMARFWVAQVRDVEEGHSSSSGAPSGDATNGCKIKIRWYEPCQSNADLLSAKYKAATMRTSNGVTQPWTDEIDDSAVVVSFNALTKAGTLPMAVRRHLKEL